jgi:hypothetical protein
MPGSFPDPEPKKKKPRNRSKEYAERNQARRKTPAPSDEPDEVTISGQLILLQERTKGKPTDADSDIDFAYRHLGSPSVTPLMAPSTAAWEWYLYARTETKKFLEIAAKREDAKAKMAGTITNQRMEDDKRQQFAVIERLKKELTLDVAAIIKELMEKYPEDVLRECRKFDAQWKAFLAKEPG